MLAHRDLEYTGVDIVAELIAANSDLYATATRPFVCADMTRDDLPKASLGGVARARMLKTREPSESSAPSLPCLRCKD